MRSKHVWWILSLVFVIFAITMSIVFWPDLSLAAKIGFFACGFGAGVTLGAWMAARRAQGKG